jgi:hypothetical protein
MKYLAGLIANNFKFYRYIFLTGIDKLLAILIIIIIISLFNNKLLFNEIEYLFSIAAIIAIFSELGLSSYLFYGYRISEDKKIFLNNFKLTYTTLGFYALTLTLFSLILGFFYNFLLYYILVKSFSIVFLNVLKSWVRINDSPENYFWYSIPTNLLSLTILIAFYVFDLKINLFYFLLPNLFLLVFLFLRRININHDLIPIIKKSLVFAWPIIFNSLLYIILNNYIKIYAYNFFDSEEMYRISLIQRFSQLTFIIQVSTVAFFSKKLYMQKESYINWPMLFLYFVALMSSVFVSILITYLYVSYLTNESFSFNLFQINYLLLFIYPAIFCFNSFLELYFGRQNMNYKALKTSIVGFAVFLLIFNIINLDDQLLLLNLATITGLSTTLLMRVKLLITWPK